MRKLVLLSAGLWCSLLVACGGVSLHEDAWTVDPPTQPLLGAPAFVREHPGAAMFVSLSNPLDAAEQVEPEAGWRYVAVGFPISGEQKLEVNHYLLEWPGSQSPLGPIALATEGATPASSFYDTVDFLDVVSLRRGGSEEFTYDDDGLDRIVASWTTAQPTLVLLYEVPANQPSLTFRHGEKRFRLDPATGKTESVK
jgi:hypothetical protein